MISIHPNSPSSSIGEFSSSSSSSSSSSTPSSGALLLLLLQQQSLLLGFVMLQQLSHKNSAIVQTQPVQGLQFDFGFLHGVQFLPAALRVARGRGEEGVLGVEQVLRQALAIEHGEFLKDGGRQGRTSFGGGGGGCSGCCESFSVTVAGADKCRTCEGRSPIHSMGTR